MSTLWAKAGIRNLIFFWDIVTWDRCLHIIRNCKLVDKDFVKFKEELGYTRIRLSQKNNKLPTIKLFLKSYWHKENELGDFFAQQYKNLIQPLESMVSIESR